ncbi:MAG: UDP-N-acetylmuramate dehydrogenase [Chitinophagaceae bacterium]|nr:UDP-N-acetylmuramate dehydrogenase [Chitinophagaceae bacterium]
MQIEQNISLRQYNTFGIDVKAKLFSSFGTQEELDDLLTPTSKLPTIILGGGSNILFTKDFDGLVLKNETKGIDLIKEDLNHVYVRSGAGENWHQFVLYAIQRNWAGLENLSLIPGNVGASPMQNIGAYGVEIREIFDELEAYHKKERKIHTFSANDCEFGYRDSVFKKKYRNDFVIMNVTFRLNKKPHFNISYGAIEEELEKMGVKDLNIQAVSQAVINIRSSKLPDPAKIGNAGSFFKNPEIGMKQYNKLQALFPDIIGYPLQNGNTKLAAGWLIEACGWKGIRRGDAGVHTQQALVLVNYGEATGKELYDLSEKILQSVKRKFGIQLEREVNII